MIPLLLAIAVQGPYTIENPIIVDPKKLPKPGSQKSRWNIPVAESRPAGSTLTLPKGFKASIYAKGLRSPRKALVLPNGDVLIVESYSGRLQLLRDKDKDGIAETKSVFGTGFKLPFGIALHEGYIYVANTDSVVRFPYKGGETQAGKGETIIDGIPSKGYNQHWTRDLLFLPGGKLLLGVGSETDKDVEPAPRGSILMFNEDGSGKETFATGLRNPASLTLRPGTNEIWLTCIERDRMGNDLVPDFVSRVQKGDFFGWPWFYIGNRIAPGVPAKSRPKKPVRVPDVLVTAHSIPLDLMFYTGTQFPAKYQGDAFIAMRGSTNRVPSSGYMVSRIDFENGKWKPGYIPFATGFDKNPRDKPVYGRPVGLEQLADGSMLVVDELAHQVWRIKYFGTE